MTPRWTVAFLFCATFLPAQATLTATPGEGKAPLDVTLQATCPGCVTYTWDFGDGSPPPVKNLIQVHTYQQPGTYMVLFAGADKNGVSTNAQTQVTALGPEDNLYCSNLNLWTGATNDSYAALPQACLNTAVANTPSPGSVIQVQPQKLQAAYNSALCGQTLKLAHGQVWAGPFAFASKHCTDNNWITITSDGTLPAPGTRAQATDAPQMAKLLLKAGVTTWGDHIRFIGIEWAKQPGGIQYFVANMKAASKVIFDRNFMHGNPGEETQHGIQISTGQYIAVIDSYISEMHCIAKTGTCVDAQAISGGAGANGDVISNSGPVKIVNNYLEASTENVLFGGGTADGPGPNDVEIRRNYMFKPMRWNPSDPSYGGIAYIVKNLFELKNGVRVLFEGNVLENSWGGYTQRGYAILLTPKNQSGLNKTNLCPNCAVMDTTIRYNRISTAAGFIAIGSGPNSNGAYSQGQHRSSIHDNVADNLQYPTCFQCGTMLNELGSGYAATNPPPTGGVLSSVSMTNLTMIAVGDLCCVPGQPNISALWNIGSVPPNALVAQATNVNFTNSIASTAKLGMATTGGGTNNCMNVSPKPALPRTQWPTCFVGNSPFSGNVLVGYPLNTNNWPTGNQFAKDFTGMFVNFNGGNGGDYHLVPGSPYAGKGADIDLVNKYTLGVK